MTTNTPLPREAVKAILIDHGVTDISGALLDALAGEREPAPSSERDLMGQAEGICTIPPEGWWCSRQPGHEGPCAARPIEAPREEPLTDEETAIIDRAWERHKAASTTQEPAPSSDQLVESVAKTLYDCEAERSAHADKVIAAARGRPLGQPSIEPYELCADTFREDARAILRMIGEPAPSIERERLYKLAKANNDYAKMLVGECNGLRKKVSELTEALATQEPALDLHTLGAAKWGWTYYGPDGEWHWSRERDTHESILDQRPATPAEAQFASALKGGEQ